MEQGDGTGDKASGFHFLLVYKLYQGHVIELIVLDRNFLWRIVSGVSFNFSSFVQLEMSGGVYTLHPPQTQAASGIIRTKLPEETH